ncbi:hypothetical protein EVAR_47081_1 [Eumeta japonica]|uniref:DDE-1 domain-containing protein n=1 Tax=Eumeta variegata TaxID=151549 RepID=A0A4C1WP56_EUMVA|nr:hypothetical protein EVAR_47081_1 [Eumeta japonica]
MDPQLMLNAAPGAWGICSDSGWMSAELFLKRFKKFIEFSGATVERPVLLLLDGHSTHTHNIDLINEAQSHGVIIICFPSHTTHRRQVTDVASMRPLSTYYDQQIIAWLRSNPGIVVTVRRIAEIFEKAFIQASSMSTAVNGFKKCGIWPYDSDETKSLQQLQGRLGRVRADTESGVVLQRRNESLADESADAVYSPPRHTITKEDYSMYFSSLGSRFICGRGLERKIHILGLIINYTPWKILTWCSSESETRVHDLTQTNILANGSKQNSQPA